MSEWQLIETAPRDGNAIYAANWMMGYRGVVIFNPNGEWESVDFKLSPLGIGFYPTHWRPLPEPPK